ncbi:MAG TPA: Fic family protein [Desulfuromonadales bacterium]|nr:Fic family protein [Desulfuromonadales bacterium]
MAKYIWQSASWPKFKIGYENLLPKLSCCHALQGQLIQQVTSLGIDLEIKAQLESLTQEAVKTAEIEGEHYNPDAVRSSIARRLGLPTAGLPSPARSVDGLVDVLLDATDTNRPDLSSERLQAWQAALFPTGRSGLYEIVVGQWRTETMQIVSGRAGKEKIHYEAPPADRIDHEMQLFIEWWQKSHPDQNNTDPVIRAGVAHYWFVAIHPFADGNGRIARALSDMALAQSDGAAKRCYSLSSTIMENRDGYYSVLESTSTGQGDITEWLDWFLDCLELSLKQSKATIEKVLSLTHFWHNISDISLNDRQIKVVKKLLEVGEGGFEGGLTAKKYHGMVKGSRATLTRDLADLVDKGILLLTGERKAARYNLNWELARKR